MDCKKCGAMLAPADEACPQCGEGVDAAQASSRWKQRGLFLEKQCQDHPSPARLAEAGQAFSKARDLDDANETLHQLWIANLCNQGLPETPLVYYKNRLAAAPGDLLAARMLKVARLSAEFKLNPVKVPVRAVEKQGLLTGMLARLLKPNAFTFGMAGSSFLISLVLLAIGLSLPSVAPLPAGGGSGGEIESGIRSTDGGTFFLMSGLLFNPYSNFLSCVFWGGYFVYLWKAAKK